MKLYNKILRGITTRFGKPFLDHNTRYHWGSGKNIHSPDPTLRVTGWYSGLKWWLFVWLCHRLDWPTMFFIIPWLEQPYILSFIHNNVNTVWCTAITVSTLVWLWKPRFFNICLICCSTVDLWGYVYWVLSVLLLRPVLWPGPLFSSSDNHLICVH